LNIRRWEEYAFKKEGNLGINMEIAASRPTVSKGDMNIAASYLDHCAVHIQYSNTEMRFYISIYKNEWIFQNAP
jgi:hypothetical protein